MIARREIILILRTDMAARHAAIDLLKKLLRRTRIHKTWSALYAAAAACQRDLDAWVDDQRRFGRLLYLGEVAP